VKYEECFQKLKELKILTLKYQDASSDVKGLQYLTKQSNKVEIVELLGDVEDFMVDYVMTLSDLKVLNLGQVQLSTEFFEKLATNCAQLRI
jgi:hypothetical protein